jgi:hypothetical protein
MDESHFLMLLGCLQGLPVEWIWDVVFEERMKQKRDCLTELNYDNFQIVLSRLIIRDLNQCSEKYMTILRRRNVRYGQEKWTIKLDCRIFEAPETQGSAFRVDSDDELLHPCQPSHTPCTMFFPYNVRKHRLEQKGKHILKKQEKKLRKLNLPPFQGTNNDLPLSSTSSSASSDDEWN